MKFIYGHNIILYKIKQYQLSAYIEIKPVIFIMGSWVIAIAI